MRTLPLLGAVYSYEADPAAVTTAEGVPVDNVADHTVARLLSRKT
jgi:hypothetical protein